MAKNLEISFLLDFYGSMLTEKQRIMIEYYYNDDLSLAEIADNEGITRQGVRDSIKRAEGQLLELEERLGNDFSKCRQDWSRFCLRLRKFGTIINNMTAQKKLIPAQTILCSWQSSCAIKKSTERVK